MPNIYRHGDIILKPIEKLPENLKVVSKENEFVLARGETTGHKHLLVAEEPQSMEILQDKNGRYYLKFYKPVKLTHEEHKTLTIEPGIYEVFREREYDYFEDEINWVVD